MVNRISNILAYQFPRLQSHQQGGGGKVPPQNLWGNL